MQERLRDRARAARQRARMRGATRGREPGALTIDALEAALGIPVDDWDAYETALAIVDKGLSDGVAVRGYWTGPIAERDAVETDAHGRVRHGWILTPTGRILDPLRWLFEDAAPYVYEGVSDHYEAAS
jgi:hypothetical protein